MADASISKTNAQKAASGEMGQTYLATGQKLAMRLWQEEAPSEPKPETQRDYEMVGYVIAGRAELQLAGEVIQLHPGDSWVVPQQTAHSYRILEPFTAIEATSPPARAAKRDAA
ncbi:cupin domain-containing protein [Almyronema epifaneia]|uniref:Cupin domain-containing protein n=1 Tax=Almyronema epifaneia S1 TaxID=2991925 RepID=A0ABW6IIL5_9CYAN